MKIKMMRYYIKNNIVYDLIAIAIVFSYVFNLTFNSMPAFSTGKIAFVVMLIFFGKNGIDAFLKFSSSNHLKTIVFYAAVPYLIFFSILNDFQDQIALSRAIWFLVYSLFGSFLIIHLCKFNVNKLLTYFFLANFLQSLFVFASVFNVDFRDWVELSLVNSGNIDFSEGVRFSGLSNGGGAALSVQLAIGVISGFILNGRIGSSFAKFMIFLLSLTMAVATIFVGRTGLYISVIFLILIIFKNQRIAFFTILLLLSLGYVLIDGMLLNLDSSVVKVDRLYEWAFDFFLTGESDSANHLAGTLMNLKSISALDLLMGTGRVSNADGTNFSGHDSGYIHSIYSLGIPLALIYYLSVFLILKKYISKLTGFMWWVGVLLVCILFLLEIKEPFVFKYFFYVFVFAFLYLSDLEFKHNLLKIRISR